MSVATPRVLVVSESRITRRVVEMTFADQPLQLAVFAAGRDAIADWQSRPPAMLIADVAMAAPDGYALARELRGHAAGATAAVLLLAGQTDVIDEPAVVGARVSAVLRKPLDSHQLIDAVRQALRAGPPPAAGPDRGPVARPADQAPAAVPTPPAGGDLRATADDGLAEVFHALLDVEQGIRPALVLPPVSDDDIDRIASRVAAMVATDTTLGTRLEATIVDRAGPAAAAASERAAERLVPDTLSGVVERVVRELAPALVEQIAHGVVREEIARLRGTARSA